MDPRQLCLELIYENGAYAQGLKGMHAPQKDNAG